ncbi:putative damage-inducible protein DinB [Paenibacillus anaericanus]|uniref:hypothetical protein n=1 Tax=Paenibacillus anaericanus TaxID=170367 RepID=UPI002788E878|nr:hypothetical protein [Paenibacillus anaericanus]MDQ0088468.1 putative damage-inducible protein DinB [Paenibacillus anaericanus]
MNDLLFGETFLRISLHRMCDLYFLKLSEAFKPLNKEQLWVEQYPGSNSVGGIVMHVTEHIHRNCLRLTEQEHLLGQDFHNFFPNSNFTPEQLLDQMEQQLKSWKQLIIRYINNPNEFNMEHVHHIYHLVEHASYHLAQVIDRIQGITGIKFEFCKQGLNEKFLRDQIEASLIK